MPSIAREANIHLRALAVQRDLIDRAASATGRNRTDFMLEAACEKARATLLDRTLFDLSGPSFRQFVKRLDSPPANPAAVLQLLKHKAPWKTAVSS